MNTYSIQVITINTKQDITFFDDAPSCESATYKNTINNTFLTQQLHKADGILDGMIIQLLESISQILQYELKLQIILSRTVYDF